ncbi:hypothetical protein CJI17_14825 [Aeromonas salmonicida]|nr:hypothetical protein CJI17_14825 [Aeromonas salmonicida]
MRSINKQDRHKLTNQGLFFCVHNAFYVQSPISHGKTTTQPGYNRLYHMLEHSNPQSRTLVCNALDRVLGGFSAKVGFRAFLHPDKDFCKVYMLVSTPTLPR